MIQFETLEERGGPASGKSEAKAIVRFPTAGAPIPATWKEKDRYPLPKPWTSRTPMVVGLLRGLWFLIHREAEPPHAAGLLPPQAF
jgi:hypothetical protein